MKKILYISLLCILLTGCGNKEKEEKNNEKLTQTEQEQIEKAQEDVYSVMSQIMVEYQLSSLDSELIAIPFTVICKENEGCKYGKGTKIELEVTPKKGTFTLKDGETMLFEPTTDIVIGDYACSIDNKNIVICKK